MAWLVCTAGDDKGLRLELKEGDEYLVGRQDGCAMRLVDTSASREHCRIAMKGERLLIEDLKSHNGVKHDGKRYIGKTLKIKLDDHFEIGSDRFDFMESYELYLEASKEVLDDLKGHSEEEMLANYAKMVAQVSIKRRKQRKKSFFARLFGR